MHPGTVHIGNEAQPDGRTITTTVYFGTNDVVIVQCCRTPDGKTAWDEGLCLRQAEMAQLVAEYLRRQEAQASPESGPDSGNGEVGKDGEEKPDAPLPS